jgi:hypothetical protein
MLREHGPNYPFQHPRHRLSPSKHGSPVARGLGHVDRLRRAAGARSRRRADPGIASEYLYIREGQPPISANRPGSVSHVGELAPDKMAPRLGDIRPSPTVHRRVEHGRCAVAPHLLDRSSGCFFFVDCIASRGSRMALCEWTTVVGRSSTGGAAIELARVTGARVPRLPRP